MAIKNLTKNGRVLLVHSDGTICVEKAKDRLGRTLPARTLSQNPCGRFYKEGRGHLQVSVGLKKYAVHRLVAEAFLPNPDELPDVDHIDGDTQHNDVSNLRWLSRGDNLRARQRIGGSSAYRGVRKTVNNTFQARVHFKGATKHLGTFPTEIEAAYAYNQAATQLGFLPESLNKI